MCQTAVSKLIIGYVFLVTSVFLAGNSSVIVVARRGGARPASDLIVQRNCCLKVD